MSDLTKRLAGLSPEKRELLLSKLKTRPDKGIRDQQYIQPRPDKNLRPLSYSQRGFWFLEQVGDESPLNNIPAALRLKGALDVTALQKSFDDLFKRHEILHVHFANSDGEPVHVYQDNLDLQIPVIDLSSDKNKLKRADEIAAEEALRPLPLDHAPLLRTSLIRLDENDHILLLTLHHIIADAWSIGILIRDVLALYEAHTQSKAADLPPLTIQYFDYAVWQKEFLQSSQVQAQLNFWREQLKDMPANIDLPVDFIRPSVQSYRGLRVRFKLSSELSLRILELSRTLAVTPFMYLLAAFRLLLSKYSRQEDFGIGVPLANRHYKGSEQLIGLFINTVVMRTKIDTQQSFRQLLQNVKKDSLNAFSNADIPFEMVVKELSPARELSRNPFFQVLFDFQNAPKPRLTYPGLTIETIEQDNESIKFDLVLSMLQGDDGLQGILSFNRDLFRPETAQRMVKHFRILLDKLTAQPDAPLQALSFLDEKEYEQIVFDWNKTSHKWDTGGRTCVHNLFELQAEKHPDRTALIDYSDFRPGKTPQTISYNRLNRDANKLARYLLKNNIKNERFAAICLDRSPAMISSLLAVLKAGGAYIPVDPAYPQERIRLIMEDAKPTIVITANKYKALFSDFETQVIAVDEIEQDIKPEKDANPDTTINSDHPAYLIYTSGSTGLPKAVLVRHQSLLNHALALSDLYNFDDHDRILQFISLSFDAAAEEIYPALINGVPLVLTGKAADMTPFDMTRLINEARISLLHLPVPLWHNWVDYHTERSLDIPETLRLILVGGESPSAEKLRLMRQRTRQPLVFVNAYGPTETTVTCCYHKIDLQSAQINKRQIIPIGTPLPNVYMYILDERLSPVPVGVRGEIYIGGIGVSRGYLNRPEITAEKFLPDPFCGQPGARMYKTGDLGRYNEDGEILFIGRLDQQIKLRGFRIEPGEIEAVLQVQPQVKQAAVLVHNNQRLVAYIVPSNKQVDTEQKLRKRLADTLPEYMVPEIYVFLDELPLTPNGKIDRKKLPDPFQDTPLEYEPPRGKLETYLYEMWREILGIEKISRKANFFSLGGNSIQAATFVNRLQDVLGEYVYIVAIYDAPTIASLAELLKKDYPQGVSKITGEKIEIKPKHKGIGPDDEAHFRQIVWSPAPFKSGIKEDKNPPAVFVLSSPRSGSTLTRAILGGSPRLFSPPELQLLNYNTLRERRQHLSGRDEFWLDGTVRAIMAVKQCGVEEARALMRDFEEQNMPVKEFYRKMQHWLGDRLFVDKTPNYALHTNILQRAEDYFKDAVYIHLIRHPYGVIPSFEKAKLHVFYPPFFTEEYDYTPGQLAELVWLISHQNILEFLKNVPAKRQFRLYYEDLVQKPQHTVQALCNFLGIDPHPDMLEPQKNKETRMTDGLNDLSKMLGDVRFHEHSGITAERAYQWKQHLDSDYLSDRTWELVEQFGYEKRRKIKQFLVRKSQAGKKTAGDDSLLSFSQQRLWFLDHLEPDSPFYNMPMAVRIQGPVIPAILEKSVNAIVRRHEVLRTAFRTKDGKPVADILDHVSVPLQFEDFSAIDPSQKNAEIEQFLKKEAARPFKLNRPPLLRTFLLKTGDESYVFLLNMHHIISDGLSLAIFIRELVRLYEAFADKKDNPLPELTFQYKDFARWQKNWLSGRGYEQHLAYWKEKLAGSPALFTLPADRPRPRVQSFHGGKKYFNLSSDITARIMELSRQQGVTPYLILLTAFKILLKRYIGHSDVVVGTPVSGRLHKKSEALIGFFVNTLVLRTNLDGNPSFIQAVERVGQTLLEAFKHQEMPFEKIVDALRPERNLSYTPLFQIMFSYQEAPTESQQIGGLSFEPMEIDTGSAKFDLTLSVTHSGNHLHSMLEYNTDLYDGDTIERFIDHFNNLLNTILRAPDSPIDFVDFLGKSERQLILRQWSRGKTIEPDNACFHELFEKEAQAHPQRPAVVYREQELTYGELNRKANQLARLLSANKLESEEPVGIFLPRSNEMLVAILAALKAGGVYLPLDPDYPSERLDFIIRDSGLLQVITMESLRSRLPRTVQKMITMDSMAAEIEAMPDDNLSLALKPENGAYIIYTSGSTGKPKGVFVQHSSMLNLLRALETDIYSKFGRKTLRASLNAPILFDASVQQIVLLAAGHTLYVVPAEARMSGEDLLRFIREHQLEVLDCVPSQLKLLLDAGLHDNEHWQPLICLPGGEAIDETVWRQLKSAPKTQYFNVYGPTECTVDSTIAHVNNSGTRPVIGKAVANAYIYVLDENFQIVPAGVAGQICIGGAGLARGYLARPELTAERFVHDPYSERKGARMYLTGDLGRFRKDGTLEFLGRLDHQVKVRGFRIELGEIEANLQEHPEIKDAVVIAVDVSGSKQLAAYLVSDTDNNSFITEIRDFLSGRLPEYMIPAYFTFLDTLPLTPNGKVDRKRLPAPQIDREALQSEYVEARNEREQILTDIWKELLNTERIGIKDNFFELGGDSILTIQVVARAKQAGLKISPKLLFEHPTIEELAEAAEEGVAVHAEQGAVSGNFPLTPIQRWFMDQNLTRPSHWNQSLLIRLNQPLREDALRTALNKLAEHHDILRARFRKTDKDRQAVIEENSDFSFSVMEAESEDLASRLADVQNTLNIETGPLARAVYFKNGRNRWLFITVHHLVIDGISWRILLEDFYRAYTQIVENGSAEPQLPPKTTSFKYWAQKLIAHAASETVLKEADYWRAAVSRPAEPLPVDIPKGRNLEMDARTVKAALNKDETEALLKQAPAAYHTQINELLLTALTLAWKRWTGKSALRINLEGHGREDLFEDVDISRTVGWFTVAYPAYFDIAGSANVAEAIKTVKEQYRSVPNNGLGFGLLKYHGPQELQALLQNVPPADIGFNYLGQFDQTAEQAQAIGQVENIPTTERHPENRRVHVLDIGGSVLEGRLTIHFSYSENLHHQQTVQRWLDDYMDSLRQVINHCLDPESGAFTPSDFKDVQLDEDELEGFMSELEEDLD